jgi:hypothetical protein
MRLHLIISLDGSILAFDLSEANTRSERLITPGLLQQLDHVISLTGDKGYIGAFLREEVQLLGSELITPEKAVRGTGTPRKTISPEQRERQAIERVFRAFKRQLSLTRLQAITVQGLITRIMQRILAWESTLLMNHSCGLRPHSLIAYDH